MEGWGVGFLYVEVGSSGWSPVCFDPDGDVENGGLVQISTFAAIVRAKKWVVGGGVEGTGQRDAHVRLWERTCGWSRQRWQQCKFESVHWQFLHFCVEPCRTLFCLVHWMRVQ